VHYPGGPNKPIVAYHTVEKSRMRKFGNTTKTIYEGNFAHSSRQMEHAILIDLLEQVTSHLTELDIMLDVTVDGDLDTNKTLAGIPIVHQIYADLKHLTRNIRKNLGECWVCKYSISQEKAFIKFYFPLIANKKNAQWQRFEQHIMRHFRGCMITAGLHADNPDIKTPLESELREVQVDGLIHHLTDDHSMCWPEVCWYKDNPELTLQEPHLKHASDEECQAFKNMLVTIFRLPKGQGLVTSSRTSHNEAFNRRKLVFLDKRIDYWKSYMARHACAVMLQNMGLTEMIKQVRSPCVRNGFSADDMHNLEKIARTIKAKQLANRKVKADRNAALHAKFAEDRSELCGVDFSSVSN
jgi:hypothetical protein